MKTFLQDWMLGFVAILPVAVLARCAFLWHDVLAHQLSMGKILGFSVWVALVLGFLFAVMRRKPTSA